MTLSHVFKRSGFHQKETAQLHHYNWFIDKSISCFNKMLIKEF